jgi:hypothetical protein
MAGEGSPVMAPPNWEAEIEIRLRCAEAAAYRLSGIVRDPWPQTIVEAQRIYDWVMQDRSIASNTNDPC